MTGEPRCCGGERRPLKRTRSNGRTRSDREEPDATGEPETTVTPERQETEPEDLNDRMGESGWVTEPSGDIRISVSQWKLLPSPGWEKIGKYWYYFDSRGRLETETDHDPKSGTYYLTGDRDRRRQGRNEDRLAMIDGSTHYFREVRLGRRRGDDRL